MDIEKMKQWQEMAKQFYGNDFWNGIFDTPPSFQTDKHENGAKTEPAPTFPCIDLYRSDDEFVLIADLPGVRRETLQCSLERDRITLRGKVETSLRGKEPVLCERRNGDFERTVQLPGDAVADGAVCKLEQGVLTVRVKRIPKSGQTPLPIRTD